MFHSRGTEVLLWIETAIHGCFGIVSLCLVLAWDKLCQSAAHDTLAISKLPFHNSRFFLQSIVIMLVILQAGESVIVDIHLATIAYRIYSVIIAQVFGIVTSMVMLYTIEKHRKFSGHVVSVLYFLFAFTCELLKTIDYIIFTDYRTKEIPARNVLQLAKLVFIVCLVILDISGTAMTRCYRVKYRRDEVLDFTNIAIKQEAHVLSKLVFHWMQDFITVARKRPVEDTDVLYLPEKSLSSHEALGLKNGLENSSSRSLAKAITRLHALEFVEIVVISVFASLLNFSVCLCLYAIVSYVTTYHNHNNVDLVDGSLGIWPFLTNGFIATNLLLYTKVLETFADLNNYFTAYYLGNTIQAGLRGVIYEKLLRIPCGLVTNGAITAGKLVNLTVADTENVHLIVYNCLVFVRLVVKIALGMGFLYYLLGPSGLLAGSIILVLPVYALLLHLQGIYKTENFARTDKRLKFMNELLMGVRFLKLQGWDRKFAEKVEDMRSKELVSWTKVQIFKRLLQFILQVSPLVVLWMTNYTFVKVSSSPLTPAIVLTSLSVIHTLMHEIKFAASAGEILVASIVSISRIERFLSLTGLPAAHSGTLSQSIVDQVWQDIVQKPITGRQVPASPNISEKQKLLEQKSNTSLAYGFMDKQEHAKLKDTEQTADPTLETCAVMMKDATFHWHSLETETSPALFIDKLQIRKTGGIICIVGPSGSGKTSLLTALLGEMMLTDGNFDIDSEKGFSFCAQTPWILNATLKHNICMNEKDDLDRYEMVIRACALDHDRAMLPDGDETELGEQGCNLSGGQRARISIARAMYSHHQLVLLDDPLSALDAKVAEQVFAEAIKRLLMQNGRTVIFATHNLKLAARANHVIVLGDRAIRAQGSWESVVRNVSNYIPDVNEDFKLSSDLTVAQRQDSKLFPEVNDNSKGEASWHTQTDERLTGNIKLETLTGFASAVPWYFLLLLLIMFVLVASSTLTTDYFMAKWTDLLARTDNSTHTPVSSHEHSVEYFYYTYVLFLIITISATAVLMISEIVTGYSVSKRLHQRMLTAVTNAPIYFFDTHLQGTVLNRFSNDMFVLDHQFLGPTESSVQSVFGLAGGMVLQVVANAAFLCLIVPFLIISWFLIKHVSSALIELIRLKNIGFSPMLAHLTQTFTGLTTIRATRCQGNMLVEYLKLLDRCNAYLQLYQAAYRWMAIHMDFIISVFVTLASVAGLLLVVYDKADPTVVGLAITYTIQASSDLRMAMTNGVDLLTQINAIDRILHYCRLKPEVEFESHCELTKNLEGQSKHRKSYRRLLDEAEEVGFVDNLAAGQVKYCDVSLAYHDDLPDVVNQVTLTVDAGTSLGICGRTGSGKTSLVYGLFRLIEISGGNIIINGEDVMMLPLHEHRKRITIVPQDPTLFNDTIRYNLDPFHKYTDEAFLWDSLDIVDLKHRVQSLDDEVSEHGANFSAGERQLFCLARAVLQKSPILVLDEATSSVDLETDHVIQQVLADHFKDTTRIIIAHRVSSLLNFDKIAVMADGRLVEVDTPAALLQIEGGQFRSFFDATMRSDYDSSL